MKIKSIAALSIAMAGLVTTSTAFAQSGPSGSWGSHGMMGGMPWFMGPIMMLLFLGIVVGVVFLAVRLFGGAGCNMGGSPRRGGSSARAILEERFARGEIDEEEFRKRKQALEE
ncbi:SHOCT domain-containing protein [Spiribacter vilamensis]|uniref:Putative membrane protein n=1 Tax=Spiribacter vilamensis TaxID=531306 RepID=A0A4Q8D173_9GAMM|nr:SHOCT domain-containing protein [Spiribacter vilamensis]RZU99042.1 putative membrane protein [Spiribacter vilamensis]